MSKKYRIVYVGNAFHAMFLILLSLTVIFIPVAVIAFVTSLEIHEKRVI